MLDPGGETTWDTERGHQPPWAGLMSCQAGSAICQPRSITHHHPHTCRGGGAEGPSQPSPCWGDPALLSASPLARKHQAKRCIEPPSPSPPTGQDPPAGGGCRLSPNISNATWRRALPLSQPVSHLHHCNTSGVSAHLLMRLTPHLYSPLQYRCSKPHGVYLRSRCSTRSCCQGSPWAPAAEQGQCCCSGSSGA